MKQTFDVTGMSCAACSARVSKTANEVPGVNSAVVNLLKSTMEVDFDGNPETTAAIRSAVEKAGYGATPKVSSTGAESNITAVVAAAEKGSAAKEAEAKRVKMRLIVSSVFCIPLFYLAMGHMFHWPTGIDFMAPQNLFAFSFTQLLLVIPIVFVNFSYFRRGFESLMHRAPNMDSLVALGSAASLVYSIYNMYVMGSALGLGNVDAAMRAAMNLYFDSAGMILTLITLGKYFEARAKGKTTGAIESLVNLSPKTAIVLRDGEEAEIPASDVCVGDILAVRTGAVVPTDGVVLKGNGSVDESAITGESIPVDKTAGSTVTGATINRSGWFSMKATRVGDETALAQIIKLVDDATSTKAPIERIADKIAGVFVPVVMVVALATLIIWFVIGTPAQAINHAITVLVISCPCALGLATPTAIMVGTGRGATHGILIKSAETLETAHAIKTVVFDKTGTITTGKPQVTGVFPSQGTAASELVETAATIEGRSEHPLAQAICEYAGTVGQHDLSTFEQIPGEGLCATIDGATVLGGNARMMQGRNIDLADMEQQANQLAANGATPLFFAHDGKLLGIVALSDVPKASSKQALAELVSMGIRTIMLTGDNRRTAEAIGHQIGAESVIADVLPQDKEERIRQLGKQGSVAMVGDGINDAPALARANVGIAVGAGTDVAIESADAVLMRNNLMDVPTMVQLSQATMRNIKQNLFWALFYNAICIPVAMGVLAPLGVTLNPMIAAAAMSCSSVCVVTNALRLRAWKPRFASGEPEANWAKEPRAIPWENERDEMSDHPQDQGKNAPAAPAQHDGADPTRLAIPYDPVQSIRDFKVEGMHCMKCVGRITQALQAIDGVERAEVDLDKENARVFLSKPVDENFIADTVNDLGFTCTPPEEVEIVDEQNFAVSGMHCMKCVKRTSQALAEVPGVEHVKVDLENERVCVKTSRNIPQEELFAAVTKAGFTPSPV